MILNNSQANIFKVNGGIADNFANRPTANGSFYIFYSLDTQEIFYDSGTWVLIGSGNINVPNWDQVLQQAGIFTGNRSAQFNDNNVSFSLGFTKAVINYNGISNSIYTENQLGGNQKGLKLDFANNQYYLGDIFSQFSYLLDFTNKSAIIGDINGSFNGTAFEINDIAQIIQSFGQGNSTGLKLDFANDQYTIGNVGATINNSYILLDNANGSFIQEPTNIKIGDGANYGNNTYLLIADNNNEISTYNAGNNIGLKLDFVNSEFTLGGISDLYNVRVSNSGIDIGDYMLNFANGTQINLDNTLIKTQYQGNDVGIKLDFSNDYYLFGNFVSNTFLLIHNAAKRVELRNGSDITGFRFDIANATYLFGENNTNSQANFVINSSVPSFETYMFGYGLFDGLGITATSAILGYNNINTGTKFVVLASGSAIYTVDNNLGTGLRLDFSANDYTFGQFGGSNKTYLKIDDSINLLFTSNQNTNNGLRFEFSNKIYLLGHYNGGNNTHIKIEDNAIYPMQLNGVNLLSGSSGGTSGQHLKVNINGVNYKIRLENP